MQAPTTKKYFIFCGQEFVLENSGKVGIVCRAVHRGKTAGRDFRNYLISCIEHLSFAEYLANPDVWMKLVIKLNGQDQYDHVLLYAYDDLVTLD